VTVHQGFKETHSQPEIRAKRSDAIDRAQQAMMRVHSKIAVFAVSAEAFRVIVTWIVSDGGGSNLSRDIVLFEKLLHASHLPNGQGAFQRVIAAGVKKSHDGRLPMEKFAV
jgi:hypothetical protein